MAKHSCIIIAPGARLNCERERERRAVSTVIRKPSLLELLGNALDRFCRALGA